MNNYSKELKSDLLNSKFLYKFTIYSPLVLANGVFIYNN